MANNSHYWTDKESRAACARRATEYIETHCVNDIDFAINHSYIYGENARTPKQSLDDFYNDILVVPIDSVSALYKYSNGKTCVLNFASYKHPGGHYLNGSKAQEECLCSESILYNVLSRFTAFYEWNNQHNNKHLYANRAIYSSGILFNRDRDYRKFDVLTCAAPNFSAASQYCNVSVEENEAALKSRIDFIIDILNDQEVDTVILGAFGCGVFGQNATIVAKYFKEAIKRLNAEVIFAVLQSEYDTNYQQFARVFS